MSKRKSTIQRFIGLIRSADKAEQATMREVALSLIPPPAAPTHPALRRKVGRPRKAKAEKVAFTPDMAG